MIYLLDLDKVTKTLRPVTSTEYVVGKSTSYHPEGLFSEIIFGSRESVDRRKLFSYIELHCKVLHPALMKPIELLNRKVSLAINKKAAYSMDAKGFLTEDKDGKINSIHEIYKNFDKIINRPEESKRRKDMRNMVLAYHKKGIAFIDKCIVMPAGQRDGQVDEVHGGMRFPPINDYYLKIVRQSLQLQSMSVSEGAMYDILSAKMQQLIDELYEYLVTKISKKQGMIRQNILGKRVDYSGRAVITGGAGKIKVDELGVPLKMLVKLFEPFILFDINNSGNVDKNRLSQLLKEWDGSTLSIISVRSLLTSIHSGFIIPKELEDLVRASVARAIKDKVILAKRDPSLHAESVQALKPVIVDGDTIQLPIGKCASYNADFDGDQMAVYVPVTREAIAEARDKLLTSASKDTMTGVGDEFSKDIVIGLYTLTQDSPSKKAPLVIRNDDELEKLEPLEILKYDGVVTTVGRVLFNKILPSPKYYSNKPISKKDVSLLIEKIYSEYGKSNREVYVEFCNKLVNLGVKYFTIMAPSFTMDDLNDIPKEVLEMKQKIRDAKTPTEANIYIEKNKELMKLYLEKKNTNIGVIGKAGALKNGYGQVNQILVSKGLVNSPTEVKVLADSYADGFNSSDFFKSGYGSRQGIIDRVLNTSTTGYLSRQLVYALQRVEADPRIIDCRTKRFFTLKATPDVAKRLKGRNIVNKMGKIIPFNETEHLNKVIHLRSPVYCTSKSICRTCYGELLMRNRTKYVGVLAGEICGERLTQTIMKSFHVGGAITIKTVDIIKDLSKIMEDSDKHYLLKSFKQEESRLISLTPGKMEIVVEEYKENKGLKITNEKVDLDYAFFRLKYLSYDIDVTIDNKIEIDLKDKKISEKDGVITIDFPENSIVFDCLPTPEIFSEKVKVIESLLSGRTPIRMVNGDHFCLKIYAIYSELSGADLIHFEILASNLLRDKGNPSFPARLNPNYSPVIKSLKSVCNLESWLQSLAFENPKQSITTGLIYDRPTDETILEKLITGKF